MASALVNNVGLVAAEGFLDLTPSSTSAAISCGWLSPRISFSRDFSDDDDDPNLPAAVRSPGKAPAAAAAATMTPLPPPLEADLGGSPGRDLVVDFEFLRLGDPATMLAADELFSDGKLVPLRVTSARPPPPPEAATVEAPSPRPQELRPRAEEVSGSGPCPAFSPRAPRCSSRWRELLGLKRAAQNAAAAKLDGQQSSSSSSSSSAVAAGLRSPSARSLKRFLHRSRGSCSIDSSLRLPLLRDDSDPLSVCSRLSLSSSSSGPDHDDLPRLSLDSDRPSHISISLARNPPRVRLAPKPSSILDPSPAPFTHHHSTPVTSGAAAAGGRIGSNPMRRAPPEDAAAVPTRNASAESPRMNASGKVVFHGLERSSSSPSTFSGGARVKHRGMERSYSANVVRVSPVLNVPVCSLRGSSRPGSVFGFGQLFSSQQRKDSVTTGLASSGAARSGGVAGRSARTERPQ